MRTALATALLVLSVTTVRAEVRLLAEATVDVQLTPTPRGPWSPVGRLTPLVLNPDGDVLGDGYPALASAPDSVAVGWVRLDDGLQWSVGSLDGWLPTRRFRGTDLAGTPQLVDWHSGWLLAFNRSEPARVEAISVDATGALSEHVALGAGHLLGAGRSDTVAHVVVVDHGLLLAIRVDADTSRRRLVARQSRLPAGGVFGASIPLPFPVPIGIERIGVGGTLSLASADIRVHDGVRDDDRRFALVTWWSKPNQLKYIELTDDGPEFPIDVMHVSTDVEYDQRYVERAIELVRDHR